MAEAARVFRSSAYIGIEDVAQTAIADYLLYATHEQIQTPGAAVRVFTRRRAIKHLNKWIKRRADLPVDHIGHADHDHQDEAIDLPAPGTSLSAARIRQDTKKLIAAAISRLAPVDQKIARLTYLVDPPLPAPSVAKRVALTPGAVRNHLVAIRRTLRGLLEGQVA